ncbi:hypothetical protein IGI04_019300 [Brassica rapa subsp. trilocularis]|uniref:Uncharacterized protein n=1 Tax=Brassica rapa subsp. trilocularis TaxID=1813537 RepID=A0ABQ7MFF2_BRACM|nr:hypothetical protein IGI04_019300 [Brassica rapa subsp. trilocularis]
MTGTQLLDELAQAVRSLVQLYQLNYVRLDPRKGYFPYLNGNRQCEFRFPQFGARRRGGYGLLLLMATKHLIETMSGYMKDKLAALTAPMANAYANAVVFNKIENLVATFRHRKSTKTSSRFLPVNKKGNDKSYQNPIKKSRCVRVLPKHVFRKHFGRIKLVLPKKPLKDPYVNRGKRKHNKTRLGRYVATEHTRCSRPSTHAARSLRSDRAHTLLGRYVATKHAHGSVATATSTHAARSLRSARVRTRMLGATSGPSSTLLVARSGPSAHTGSVAYVADRAHTLTVATSDREHPLLGSLTCDRHATLLGPLRSDLSEVRSHCSRPVRPQKGRTLGSLLNPHRNTFRFVSIGVSVEILRRKQRPGRPQKGPPLVLFLNPRRTLFVSSQSAVSVEIYDAKKVDSSRLASTRYVSDGHSQSHYVATWKASDRSSLGSLWNSCRNAFSFRLTRSFVELLRRNKYDASGLLPFATIATCTTSKSLRTTCKASEYRTLLGCFHLASSALFRTVKSYVATCKAQKGPPLRSPLNPLRNAFWDSSRHTLPLAIATADDILARYLATCQASSKGPPFAFSFDFS